MIRILFICHGSICRSPMCKYYFQDLIERKGLAGEVEADCAATSTEEIGNPVHRGTREKLRQAGISCEGYRARQMRRGDYAQYDYLIGMDQWNIRNMKAIAGGDPQRKIHKLLEFAGSDRDVADPWYTGDFDATWRDVEAGCAGLLAYLGFDGQN